jgi:diaminopimelate decarboxylase
VIIFDIIRPSDDSTPSDDPGRKDGHRRDAPNRSSVPGSRARADTAPQSVTAPNVLRHYRQYRTAFPWAGITCDAAALRQPEVVTTVRKRGHSVDVHSCQELTAALSAGFPGRQIVLHDDGVTAAPIRCAVNAGVGRLVLGCAHQVAVLASVAGHAQRVLVNVTADGAHDTIAAVLARPRLNLIGLHARLTPAAHTTAYTDTVGQMIAQMAHIRREQDIILTRVSLAGGAVLSDRTAPPSALRALAAELEDAFDDACARFRFPRPALILAPW